MSAIKKNSRILGVLLGLAIIAAVGAVAVYKNGAAVAQGIPTAEPLFYAGLLADTKGAPLTGSKSVAVDLWTAKTGGTKACGTPAKKVTLQQGRFRVALDKTCLAAVQKHPDLWVEVVVDGASVGRSKIGAVPYAVEAGRVAAQDCPPGYERDTSATSIVVCKRGQDQMVKAGSFWIDRYEAILVDAKMYSSGSCNGGGTVYHGGSSVFYPKGFPPSGDWTTPVYACSVKGPVPSRNMTWFMAAQACELVGKKLCSNYQWQVAAAGTHDPGKNSGTANTACHTDGGGPRKTGLAGATPGAKGSCVSIWGAEDMVGNLLEWVDMWGVAGKAWMKLDAESSQAWPSDYGDGKDRTNAVDGTAYMNAKNKFTKGLPATPLRGGSAKDGEAAGVFSFNMNNGPTSSHYLYGTRCCRE